MGFHTLLIEQIEQQLLHFQEDIGLCTEQDFTCLEAIAEYKKTGLGFDHIVALFEQAKAARAELDIEGILKQAFPDQFYEKNHLPKWVFSKIYQPLPKLDSLKTKTDVYRIKKNFLKVPALKRAILDKLLCYCYSHAAFKQKHSLTIFTWVMPDGYGDYAAQLFIAELLHKSLYNLSINLVSIFYEHMGMIRHSKHFPHNVYTYSNEETLKTLSEDPKLKKLLRVSDLVMQMPTYYPYSKILFEQERDSNSYELLGEYGFVDSSWCHPKSMGKSLGLHFLEKGIFIRPFQFADPYDIKNKELIQKLFESNNSEQLKQAIKKSRFYLSYLRTKAGHYIFLHALIKSLCRDKKDICLLVADLPNIVATIDTDFGPHFTLFRKYNIKKVTLIAQDVVWSKEISQKGKHLKIYQNTKIDQEDFHKLMKISESFVVCRGDQSFSEVISIGKSFFYDAPDHAEIFLHDLWLLAKYRLPYSPSLHRYLELLNHQESDKKQWPSIAEEIGSLMQNLKLEEDLSKLGKILREEYNANEYTVSLMKRKLMLIENPILQKQEEKLVSAFIEEEIELQDFYERLQSLIDKNS